MLGDDFGARRAFLPELLSKFSSLLFFLSISGSAHVGGFLSKTLWDPKDKKFRPCGWKKVSGYFQPFQLCWVGCHSSQHRKVSPASLSCSHQKQTRTRCTDHKPNQQRDKHRFRDEGDSVACNRSKSSNTPNPQKIILNDTVPTEDEQTLIKGKKKTIWLEDQNSTESKRWT